MRTDFRRAYMRDHEEQWRSIVARVPIVTLLTDDVPLADTKEYLLVPFRRTQNTHVSFLAPFVGPIHDHGGGTNDGIAMVEGTCIEGGKECVYLHGIDHFAAVRNTSPWRTLS
jgi:hypothetical protein